MPADALSPVSTLCLAILHHGEATGYEIKKESVEGDYRYFIDASYGSIYPALARLAADDLVTVREETQSGRPSRKIYAITETGRTALLDALSAPPGPDIFRARFLLVAKFVNQLPADVIQRALDERRQHLEDEIEHLQRLKDDAGDNRGVAWVTEYGLTCMKASLDYLNQSGSDLVAQAHDPLSNAAE